MCAAFEGLWRSHDELVLHSRSSFLDMIKDPSTPVGLHRYSLDDLPDDLHELTTTYSAVSALHNAVRRLTGRRAVEAASSAWHAEPCLRRLCSVLEDPIQHIRVSEDNFVVIEIRFPYASQAEGRIVVGPQGTGTFAIDAGLSMKFSSGEDAWRLHHSFVESLKEAGLSARREIKLGVDPS